MGLEDRLEIRAPQGTQSWLTSEYIQQRAYAIDQDAQRGPFKQLPLGQRQEIKVGDFVLFTEEVGVIPEERRIIYLNFDRVTENNVKDYQNPEVYFVGIVIPH